MSLLRLSAFNFALFAVKFVSGFFLFRALSGFFRIFPLFSGPPSPAARPSEMFFSHALNNFLTPFGCFLIIQIRPAAAVSWHGIDGEFWKCPVRLHARQRRLSEGTNRAMSASPARHTMEGNCARAKAKRPCASSPKEIRRLKFPKLIWIGTSLMRSY